MPNMEMIDDQFWLKYAKDHATTAVTKRDEGAAKLEKLVVWLWTLYTASFTIGTTVDTLKPSNHWALLPFSLPIFLLIFSYGFCVFAQMPIALDRFDPRVPLLINKAYNYEVGKKNKRLNLAILFVLLSGLSLSIALIMLNITPKKEKPAAAAAAVPQKMTASFGQDGKTLCISAQLPKNKDYVLEVDTAQMKNKKAVIYKLQANSLESGLVTLNIPIKAKPQSSLISLTWNEESVSCGFSSRLKKE